MNPSQANWSIDELESTVSHRGCQRLCGKGRPVTVSVLEIAIPLPFIARRSPRATELQRRVSGVRAEPHPALTRGAMKHTPHLIARHPGPGVAGETAPGRGRGQACSCSCPCCRQWRPLDQEREQESETNLVPIRRCPRSTGDFRDSRVGMRVAEQHKRSQARERQAGGRRLQGLAAFQLRVDRVQEYPQFFQVQDPPHPPQNVGAEQGSPGWAARIGWAWLVPRRLKRPSRPPNLTSRSDEQKSLIHRPSAVLRLLSMRGSPLFSLGFDNTNSSARSV